MKDLFPVKKYALKMKIRRQKKFRTKKYRTARMKKIFPAIYESIIE